MLYLYCAELKETIAICFSQKIVKAKYSRIIKEINDLNVYIYRVMQIDEITNWIKISYEASCDISATFTVSYAKFFYFIKMLRLKVIRKKELIRNNQFALSTTNSTLNILKKANEKGLLINYRSLKRKYLVRKSAQENKILKYENFGNYALTLTYFYLIIKKQLIEWSTGAMLNDIRMETPTEIILNECEIQIMDEYIKNLINN